MGQWTATWLWQIIGEISMEKVHYSISLMHFLHLQPSEIQDVTANDAPIDDSLLHTSNTSDLNDSVSEPTTPAPAWSAERIAKLIEPWKISFSQSTEHIPKSKGIHLFINIELFKNYSNLIVLLYLVIGLFGLSFSCIEEMEGSQ